MKLPRLTKPLLGWFVIVLGCAAIVLVGYLHPSRTPYELALAYWPVYSASVALIAVGVLVGMDS